MINNHLDPYGYMIPEIFYGESPLNLVNSCACEFWFDGLDASTFTLNGANVIQWDDKSGFGRHISQAVDAQRPTWTAVTGRVTFNSVGQTFLKATNFAGLAQPNTIFIVYKNTGANILRYFFDGGTAAITIGKDATPAFGIYGGAWVTSGYVNNNDNIHVGEFNVAASNYWINGALVAGPGLTGANVLDGITLGSQFDGLARWVNGDILEVCGYNCIITAAERNAVTAYLNAKWGVY